MKIQSMMNVNHKCDIYDEANLTLCTYNYAFWGRNHQMGPWRVNFLPLQRLSEKQKGSHVGQCKRCFQAYAANAEHRTGHYWESGVILENRNFKQQEKKLIDEIMIWRQIDRINWSESIFQTQLLDYVARRGYGIQCI